MQVDIKKAVPRRVSCDFSSNTTESCSEFDMYRCGVLYDGKMDIAFGGDYDVYSHYGGYDGNYPGFYGAYSYGFGYGGSMYINGRYMMNGYGIAGCYGCTPVGYAMNGYVKGYQGSGGSMPERYHPYWY